MKALKTKFPCRKCGDPTDVRRLREGPEAICDPCAEKLRRSHLVAWADEEGARFGREANDLDERGRKFLLGWAKSIEQRTHAVVRALEAYEVTAHTERLRFAKFARYRSQSVAKIMGQLMPLFDELLDEARHGLKAISGEGLPSLDERPAFPELRLIRNAEETP